MYIIIGIHIHDCFRNWILNRFVIPAVKFISVILFHFSLMITQDIYPDTCTKVFSHKITSDSTCKTIISRNSQIPCLQDIQIKSKLISTYHPKNQNLTTAVSSQCINLQEFCCHQVLPHSSTLQHRTKHTFTSKHKNIGSLTICY